MPETPDVDAPMNQIMSVPKWLAEVIECARDWRYSDEFIGMMLRNRLQHFDGQTDG